MSRLAILTLAAGLISITATARGAAAQQPAPDTIAVDADRAQATALAAVPGNDGLLSMKLKKKHGVLVWEFDVETPGPGHQEVRVDAKTGAVVSNKHEDDLTATAAVRERQAALAADTAATHAADAARGAANTLAGTMDQVVRPADIPKANPAVSEAKARTIAQAAVPGQAITAIDLERENGVLVWDVELHAHDQGYTDVMVDAATGRIIRQQQEQ